MHALRALFMKKPTIGFIGQGYVGKNYGNDFEKRGYKIVRYSLEEPFVKNKEKIQTCDVVFVAVPTPSTPKGFDASIVEGALSLIGKGNIAVIKSTILPGTTRRFQKKYPHLTILFSPEFLSVTTAAHDAAHPAENIIGLPVQDAKHKAAAKLVHALLPKAPFVLTCTSEEAEVFKYTHNLSGYAQIMLFNMMYDLAKAMKADWEPIRKAAEADPLISNRYAQPLHKSGRGAGGGCFIKDMAAARGMYEALLPKDKKSSALLRAMEAKNIELLTSTKKDLELLAGVYGKKVLGKGKRK